MYEAKDLLKAHGLRSPEATQTIREFHPRFNKANDAEIFNARLRLTDAQLTIARERGFPSWPRLKARIDAQVFPTAWIYRTGSELRVPSSGVPSISSALVMS